MVAGIHAWNADAESFGDSFSLKRTRKVEILNSEISSFSSYLRTDISLSGDICIYMRIIIKIFF